MVKLLITEQINRVKADIIEATQCLRMWLILDRKVLGKCTGRGNWVIPFALYTISELLNFYLVRLERMFLFI